MSPLAAIARLHGRQRETASLCLRTPQLLRAVIAVSQETFLGPYVTPQTFELSTDGAALASGQREYADGEGFFAHFSGTRASDVLCGKRVLDLGCGYGGRTVWYAIHAEPAAIAGVEIADPVVERCRALAHKHGQDDIDFRRAFGEELPFDDDTFDVVLSYDVQEHVDDPARTLEEIARVLVPGGELWMVFPTYLGARASHLDYLTQVPFLHRIFDPDTILTVVNDFLKANPHRYGVKPQPAARLTPTGRRVLPALNGADRTQSLAYIARAGLQIVWAGTHPLITENAPVPVAGVLARAMRWVAARNRLPDLLIGHLAFHLRLPPSPSLVPDAPRSLTGKDPQ